MQRAHERDEALCRPALARLARAQVNSDRRTGEMTLDERGADARRFGSSTASRSGGGGPSMPKRRASRNTRSTWCSPSTPGERDRAVDRAFDALSVHEAGDVPRGEHLREAQRLGCDTPSSPARRSRAAAGAAPAPGRSARARARAGRRRRACPSGRRTPRRDPDGRRAPARCSCWRGPRARRRETAGAAPSGAGWCRRDRRCCRV